MNKEKEYDTKLNQLIKKIKNDGYDIKIKPVDMNPFILLSYDKITVRKKK